MIEHTHEGKCGTPGCLNENIVFDAPSINGVIQNIICGVCFVDFRNNCWPKAT